MNRPPPVINSTPANSTFVEKIMVGLDHAPAAFDLRGQLIGAGGANLHYIRNETGAIATLRGRGSLFIDPAIGTESPEPMHLYIEHARFEGLQSAKQLAKNLIETMQQELAHFQQTNPPVPAVQFTPQQAPPMPNAQVYLHFLFFSLANYCRIDFWLPSILTICFTFRLWAEVSSHYPKCLCHRQC